MQKEISIGSEAREKVKAGIDRAASAVAPTLGAIGMSALIEWPGLDPIVSDDGVTILKNLEFEDPYEDMGLKMLRKGAVRTSMEAGDGTATTTVLTRALVAESFKLIADDSSKIQEVRERLIKGRDQAIELLRAQKVDVKPEEIVDIAKISSLDDEVAQVIAETINQVGTTGVVTVEKSAKLGYSSEVVKGIRFESGFLSPYFINDPEREQVMLEQPYIVLVDRRVSMNEQIVGIMNSIGKSGNNSVLFIADDVDSLALASMVLNRQAGSFKIAAVKNPFTAGRAADFLEDLAVLTGGTVISESKGMRINDATAEQAGFAERVIITKNQTTIIGGKASDKLAERVEAIKTKLAESVSDYEKVMLKDRLASLTTGIGVIRVGTYTDTDFHAKKLKFDNAINATQAALAEGILPGGGIALLNIVHQMEDPIFKRAFAEPFMQMMRNAGLEDLIGHKIWSFPLGEGVNFKTRKQVNMMDEKIIDPFKVLRLAIESAVAITLNLITTETAIVVKPEPQPNQLQLPR